MKNNKNYILFLLIGIILSGCSNTEENFNDYMKYLANKDNGLVKEKLVDGLTIKVKYLPNDYFVYNEKKSYLANNIIFNMDSLKQTYKNSLTFMLTIGPDSTENFDITRAGISSYEEYSVRIEQMSFNMINLITLEAGSEMYYPMLAQMESATGLKKNRDFIIVFEGEKIKEEQFAEGNLKFIYQDEIFNTGVNKFQFRTEDINNIPQLLF